MFSFLFSDLWVNCKAINAIINALITEKLQKILKKEIDEVFWRLTVFSILFNDHWHNCKAMSDVNSVLLTQKKKQKKKIK